MGVGGAGAFPAGSTPAGYGMPAGAAPKGHASPQRALFFDPSIGAWAFRADGSGQLLVLDSIDAKMSFLSGIPRGSLPCAKTTGHTFFQRVAAATEDGRGTAALLAAKETYADLIAAGDVALLSVTIDVPVRDYIEVRYANLRAAQSPDPTRPT